MTVEGLEAALRQAALVDDCRVLERAGADGATSTVAFAVAAPGVGRRDLEAACARWSDGTGRPPILVLLPSVPLARDGAWDLQALELLAVVDGALRARVESAAPGRAAALDWVRARPAPALHLGTMLPGWVRPSFVPAGAGQAIAAGTPADGADARPPALSDGGALQPPADAPQVLADLLLRAAAAPAPAGVVAVRADGTLHELTYAELLDQARRVLGGLRAAGLRAGDPVVLQLRHHDEFLAAFWACVLGGAVPVPVGVPPTFVESNGALTRLLQAVEMFARPLLVGDAAVVTGLEQAARVTSVPPHQALDIAALRTAAADPALHPARADEITLMMLTSGSTGRPKGVPQPHANLLARTWGSLQMHGWARGMVTLNWMPLDHVAGLIYFHLRDTHLAARQLHVPTDAVLRTPLWWLDLLEQHRVAVTFAPNFAFGLVCAQADELGRRRRDLSALHCILNGGEAIVAAPTRRFLQLLAPHGLRADAMMPAWGMSEISSGVTYDGGFRLDTTADDDAHVKVGRPVPGVRLRIVDEQGHLLREGQVGQLQVAGATVFAGYHGSGHAHGDSFTADGWFRTGDLGRLDDGRLTITGRDKDVIIINGANYGGPAIEAAVEELPGVAPSFAAACAVGDPRAAGSEGLGLFFVPTVDGDAALGELLRAIRQKVVQAFGISPAVLVPVGRDDIPKTGIGKIQRGALQKALQQGRFEAALRRVDLLTANENTLPGWFFRRSWHPIAGPAAVPAAAPPCVLADGTDPLLGPLREAWPGLQVLAPDALDRATVPPAQDAWPVLWLWPDAPADTAAASAALGAAAMRVLDVARRLAALHPRLHLRLLTRRGAAVLPGERADPPRAALGALVHTLAQELPGCRFGTVDVDAATPPAALAHEFDAPPEQREAAWRAGRRHVPLLRAEMPVPPATAGSGLLRRGGRYALVGGAGGIGLLLAGWLQREFDASVRVIGRAAQLPADGWESLAGPAPEYRQADVCDVGHLHRALAADTPFDAIFHLAGSYHEAALADETPATLAAAAAPKLDGLNALLQVRGADTPVVAFSSVASLFGGALVGGYAMANRSLEAAAGAPAVWLVAWAGWQDTGMTRRFGAREPLRAMGVLDLPPAQALGSLQVLLAQPPGAWIVGLAADAAYVARRSVGVAFEQGLTLFHEPPAPDLHAALGFALDADGTLADGHGHRVALQLRSLPSLPREPDGRPDLAALELLLRQGADFSPPANDTEERVAALWRRILGVQTVGRESNFFELGGQSLLASQLVTALARTFGTTWSLRDVFESPTVAAQAARVLAGVAAPSDAVPDIDPAQAGPLASSQQRLWFLERAHPGNCAFHITARLRFAGRPDAARVQRALQAVVDRHDSLRTAFPVADGEPRRQVLPPGTQPAWDASPPAPGEAPAAAMQAHARRPFDLERGPLLRARWVETGDGAELWLVLHHIVGDGWSMKVLFRDWMQAFETDAPLPPLPAQYAHFAAWQARRAAAGAWDRERAYWARRLEGRLDGFALPTDRPRPPVQTHAGAIVRQPLPAAAARRVRSLALAAGTTPFVLLLAVFKSLLARCTQQHDVIVGTAVANRNRAEFEPLVGFIVNLVALRTDLGGDPRFVDVLRRVHQTVMDAYAHHELPFEMLVEHLQPPRDSSRPPLFQIAFDMRDPAITRSPDPRLALDVMQADLGAAQYDLHLTFEESHDAEPVLTALWQYNTDLFDADTIERLARGYATLLDGALESPEDRLARLPLLHPIDQALLARFNDRAAPFARGRCLHQLFERQVDERPEQPALVMHGGATLTYAELDAQANAWAHRLQGLGVGPDAVVGLCLGRTPALVVAMLGVLKAGGAFMPLDPAYPQDRLLHMLSDSGVTRLITDAAGSARFAGLPGLSMLDVGRETLEGLPRSRPAAAVSDRHLAYVIYTSGSTGRPKGVLLEHHGWCNVAQAQADLLGVRPGMRVLQFASASFDASAFEVSMALALGGTLVMGRSDDLMPGPALAALLREQRVSVVTLPPTALAALPEGAYPDLAVITVAGESCPADLVRRWAGPGRRFFNLYGPTEATIWSSVAECRAGDAGEPPIGVPVSNCSLHVLDGALQPLPPGLPGEIYVGGEGLARGYHRRPELDAERFVTIEGPQGPMRAYRSGDIGRLDPRRGQLEFLGRSDHQVKLRGFRIELGEIEAQLRAQPGVDAALVQLWQPSAGDPALLAHVVPAAGCVIDGDGLRDALRAVLPHFMVPAWVVVVPAFPLTPNGKIDRKRLPPPQAAAATTAAQAPQGEMERQVAEVWCAVLGLPQIDRQRNFFDAGGHSLKMAKVHAMLSERLGRALPLMDLFQYPTIAALAQYLSAGAAPPEAPADAAPASRAGADRLALLAQRQRAARGAAER